jgi:hypothetical protein
MMVTEREEISLIQAFAAIVIRDAARSSRLPRPRSRRGRAGKTRLDALAGPKIGRDIYVEVLNLFAALRPTDFKCELVGAAKSLR